jgi:hypothetical protein
MPYGLLLMSISITLLAGSRRMQRDLFRQFILFFNSLTQLYEKGIFIGHDGRIAGRPRGFCRWRQSEETGLYPLHETKLHRAEM